jgi:hypothetical protein
LVWIGWSYLVFYWTEVRPILTTAADEDEDSFASHNLPWIASNTASKNRRIGTGGGGEELLLLGRRGESEGGFCSGGVYLNKETFVIQFWRLNWLTISFENG